MQNDLIVRRQSGISAMAYIATTGLAQDTGSFSTGNKNVNSYKHSLP